MNLKQAMKKAKETGKPQVVDQVPRYISFYVRNGSCTKLKSRVITRWSN